MPFIAVDENSKGADLLGRFLSEKPKIVARKPRTELHICSSPLLVPQTNMKFHLPHDSSGLELEPRTLEGK